MNKIFFLFYAFSNLFLVYFALYQKWFLFTFFLLLLGAFSIFLFKKSIQNQNPVSQKSTQSEGSILLHATHFFDDIPFPILTFDKEGMILSSNKAAQAHIPIFTIGACLFLYFRDINLAQILQKPTEKRGIVFSHPARLWQKKLFKVHFFIADKGLFFCLFEDETNIHHARQKQADFINHASHELKTPLTILQGFLALLEDPHKYSQQEHQKFLTIMQTQITQMNTLIQNLLALVELDNPLQKNQFNKINLNVLLQELVESYQPLSLQKQLPLKLTLPPQPVYLYGCQAEIIQLLQNLCDNAFKYGEKGTHIAIYITEQDDAFSIHIQDFGIGIPAEYISRLTERFYRAPHTHNYVGNGLGLAIVKDILEHHQGKLTVQSEVDKGTIFTINFKKHYPLFQDNQPVEDKARN